jgi:hypothetical protein
LNSDALFSLGRATEVTRDELKFYKFIVRLRTRFAKLFTNLLEKQLVLKGIVSIEEWNALSALVKYDFARDNYFTELKDSEILSNRLSLMGNISQLGMLGTYYSHEWARKNILMQSDEDIKEQDEKIAEEQNDPRWAPQEPDQSSEYPEEQPTDDDGPQEEPSDDTDEPEDEVSRAEKVRRAETTMRLLKKKKERSPHEQSAYLSAVRVLSRNK